MKNVKHYLKNGTEWSGDKHSVGSKVMTGKNHTSSSKYLYHFKELNLDTKKKTLPKK